jgi:rubredoxin
MSDTADNSVSCGNCGYIFKGNVSDQEPGKRKPCPECGSIKRAFNVKTETKIGVTATIGGVYEVHMNPQSWTLLGVILAFIIPPIFYAVFSILTIDFWYRLLIWLGVIIIPFSIAYKFRIIWYKIIILLRNLAKITYGKNKI